MSTGVFNDKLNKYFASECGAFTSMTKPEVDKRTFNVKSSIKKILINKLGEDVVKKYNSTDNIARFKGSDLLPDFATRSFSLVCKYSKPDKDEMTIYFSSAKGITNSLLKEGNIWFIYFKENDNSPYLGIMSPTEWVSIGVDDNYYETEEEVENPNTILEYTFDINNMIITETDPPKPSESKRRSGTRKRISTSKHQNQLKNRKIKGDAGEKIALEFERRRLRNAPVLANVVDKVKRVSEKTDGDGFDIQSFDIIDDIVQEIFIEVKTTSGSINADFNISLNEVEVSREYKERYYIYRVYNLDSQGQDVKIYRINGSIEDNFCLSPVQFKATKK